MGGAFFFFFFFFFLHSVIFLDIAILGKNHGINTNDVNLD